VPGATFAADVPGGSLGGTVAGAGPAVLLLHGGPGLSCDYLQPVVDELAGGYRVAVYQQRGLAPSTALEPYDMATQTDDVAAVLDALGWAEAAIVGHSWGGHLLLHVLGRHPGRVSAALVIDPLGGVGDGGEELFDAELMRRTPQRDLARVEHLEQQAMAGLGSDEDVLESLRLLWPAYFADPSNAPPLPPMRLSVEAYAATFESLHAELPALAARLSGVTVPTLFLHGGAGPTPISASADTAGAIGSAAAVDVLPGAGHFPWYEHPGCVREALDRLLTRAAAGSA
jgi:pimeloyl-ACP methyl ester carboxylesterase